LSHEVITEYKAIGHTSVIQANAKIMQSLKDLSNAGIQSGDGVKALSDSLRENLKATYAMRRGLQGVRMSLRVAYAPILEFGRAMGHIANMGRDVIQMWQAYNIGIYRVENATRRMSAATEDAAYYQNLYNKYMRDFGEDSAYARDAFEKMEDAQKKAEQASKDLERANNEMWIGYAGMALMIPNFLNNLVEVIIHFKTIAGLVGTIGTGITTGIGTALATLGVPFGGMAGTGAAVAVAVPALTMAGAAAGGAQHAERLKYWKKDIAAKQAAQGYVTEKVMVEQFSQEQRMAAWRAGRIMPEGRYADVNVPFEFQSTEALDAWLMETAGQLREAGMSAREAGEWSIAKRGELEGKIINVQQTNYINGNVDPQSWTDSSLKAITNSLMRGR
jgi:hypothetical protein